MMNSIGSKSSLESRQAPAALSGIPPSGSAILLDKLNARKSTPDSEALASSDDEVEIQRPVPPPPMKPVRRTSWLNDTSTMASNPRKASFASGALSPTIAHPGSPAVDTTSTGWSTHSTTSANVIGRPHAGSASSPWGSGIWNPERRDATSRLADATPTPASGQPFHSGSKLYSLEAATAHLNLNRRDSGANSQIPFSIPLHPTPKAYRSQSYSVGQTDGDAVIVSPSLGPSASFNARARGHVQAGLQHRPSRPSMLSEMSSDLGRVREVDDDDSEAIAQQQGQAARRASEAKIELLTRENAMLRQQQYQAAQRLRPRASTGTAYGSSNGYGFGQPVLEESSEYAVDEVDEMQDSADLRSRQITNRRTSELAPSAFGPSYAAIENRNLENVKKAYWQSNPGFGGQGDLPQSRRHSFADAPTRQPSISSIGESSIRRDSVSRAAQDPQSMLRGTTDHNTFVQPTTASYYATQHGAQQAYAQSSAYGAAWQSPYGLHGQLGGRPPSPHRGIFHNTMARHTQKLYIVLFKFSRADVFYIQEGTGLSVKAGDLVIVEADRGMDLGTVAEGNVEWDQAKERKEYYAAEHYKWLVMYSQNAAAAQDDGSAGFMPSSHFAGSAVGGMGPPNQQLVQDPNGGEIKPKLIKRIALTHEIDSLRDKEANEAKAKRVCMQKVKEHGLNMEILDAEFQFDWKKLTFFYFADSYINFNSLVTDLFKLYKTRIWMSAINPASFASSALGPQAPSGIGPGAVSTGRNTTAIASERRPVSQHASQSQQTPSAHQQQQQAQQPQYNLGSPPSRIYQTGFNVVPETERGTQPIGLAFQPSIFQYGYAGFQATPRPSMLPGYTSPGMAPSMEQYGAAFGNHAYSMTPQYSSSQSDLLSRDQQPISPLGTQVDWTSQFQNLSLDPR